MWLFVLVPVIFAVAGPAAAESWREYSYPDYSFRVSFPVEPQIEVTTYRITDGRAVEAHVYAVHRQDAEFTITVAELADPSPEETAVIDRAIKTLSAGGEVKVNIPHRISRVFGRQLSIVQGDGSRTAAAVFDYNGRRYQSEGKSLGQLLDEFARVRAEKLDELRGLKLQSEDFERRGLHPALGTVTLSELLATWAVHDLTHLHQISRVMAHQYREAVGPWGAYLGVLQCAGHSS